MQLQQIADRLNAGMAGVAGERTPETWAIRVAAYRLLSQGEPATIEDIAKASAHEVAEVKRCLEGSSDLTDDGRVDAIMGLTLRPTQHRIKLGETQLYTWCALDLLFIPSCLAATAKIESASPASGAPVRAVVTPHGIHDVDPEEAVLSVVPIQSDRHDIRSAFCNFVHFFTSRADAARWQATHRDGWLLPAADAFNLGTRFVESLAGDCCE